MYNYEQHITTGFKYINTIPKLNILLPYFCVWCSVASIKSRYLNITILFSSFLFFRFSFGYYVIFKFRTNLELCTRQSKFKVILLFIFLWGLSLSFYFLNFFLFFYLTAGSAVSLDFYNSLYCCCSIVIIKLIRTSMASDAMDI